MYAQMPAPWPSSWQMSLRSQPHLIESGLHGRPRYFWPVWSCMKQRGLLVTPGQVSVGQSLSPSHFGAQISSLAAECFVGMVATLCA